MSQYNTRINIRVIDEEKWGLLSDIDFEEYGLCLSIDDLEGDEEFIIDGDWSLNEFELDGFIEALVERLKDDVSIVADTTNINVDPYIYYVCAFAGDIFSRYISYEDEDFVEQYDLNISNMDEYCNEVGVFKTDEI